jgi:hypothetical protein
VYAADVRRQIVGLRVTLPQERGWAGSARETGRQVEHSGISAAGASGLRDCHAFHACSETG